MCIEEMLDCLDSGLEYEIRSLFSLPSSSPLYYGIIFLDLYQVLCEVVVVVFVVER